MSYAIYLRKSRADMEAEARGEGETLARHQAQLMELAKRQHLEIGAIYKELVSGETIAARPIMQQLIDEVSRGNWDGIIVMEIERLARGDTMDQGLVAQAFKFSGTKIITPAKNYDPNNEFDEEYFEFNLFMSRREYKTIRRRMQAGRLASIKEGNYIGSMPPYGYKKVRDYDNKSYTLEPIEDEANTVRMMYQLYIERDMGYSKIATYLNQLGIKPKKTDTWCASSVKDIMQNPLYCGKLRWDWRKTHKKMVDGKVVLSRPKSEGTVYQGKHPPIISEELWQSAQKAPKKTSCHFNKPVQNIFVGLLVCGECGHAMVRRPYPTRESAYFCNHKGCSCMASYESEIEQALMAVLNERYTQMLCAVANTKKEICHDDSTLKIAEAEITRLKKQHEKLYDLLEQEIYTTEVFVERSAAINARIAELEKTVYDEKTKCVSRYTAEEACLILKSVIDEYPNVSDPAAKNELLKRAVQRIDYTKTTGGRYAQSDLSLKLHYIF